MRLGPLMILSKKATLGPSTRTQEDNIGLQPNPKNASRFFDDSLEEGNPWTFKREAKKATLGPSRGKRRMTTLDLQEGSKEGNLGPSRGKRRRQPWTFKREAKKATLDLQEGSEEGQPWTFKREAKKDILGPSRGKQRSLKKSPGLQREKKTPCHPRLAPCHPRLAPCHPRPAPGLCAHPPARPPLFRPPFRPPPAAIKSNPKLADKFQDTRIIDIHPKKPILALIRQKQPLF